MHIEKKKKRKEFAEATEGDMTPMIDMVFQLIAFFMLVITFNDVIGRHHKSIGRPCHAACRETPAGANEYGGPGRNLNGCGQFVGKLSQGISVWHSYASVCCHSATP